MRNGTTLLPGLLLLLPTLTAVLSSAPPAAADAPSAPSAPFIDATAGSGLDFVHFNGMSGEMYFPEMMGPAVALLDYDGDGDLDVYAAQGGILTAGVAADDLFFPPGAAGASDRLYRNDSEAGGDLTFTDVTDEAGLEPWGYAIGAAAGDFDNDGHSDLYLANYGPNDLLRNVEGRSFAHVTEASGAEDTRWSSAAAFVDYDRDGWLDLFIVNYVDFDVAKNPKCYASSSRRDYCGPASFPPQPDRLLRNRGDGTFEDVSAVSGIGAKAGPGLGVVVTDADLDGWPDLYVANDSTANQFYMNQGDGTFEETAFLAGVAVSEDGGEQGGMGVAVGDYDGSGRPSLLVTNFAEEYNAFYKNEGDYFTDVSFRTQTGAPSLPYVGWGTAFLDYDNDGWLDLFIANGHVYPQLDNAKLGASAPYRQRRLLYRNRGGGTFEEIAESQGEVLTEPRVSRGVAMGDLDRDGRVDLVINDLDGSPQVLVNQHPDPGHWLLVSLVGRAPNTSAIGATVRVTTGKGGGKGGGKGESARSQVRSVRSGTSYLSQDSFRQHFGLGDADKVEKLTVTWPDGTTTEMTDVAADRVVEIRQPAAEAPAQE